MATQEQVNAVKAVVRAIAETIRETGEQGAPSGAVYAACIGVLTLEQYQTIVDGLKTAGLVRESGHVLYWIGG